MIHGNYDTYELMRAQQKAAAAKKKAEKRRRPKDAERKAARPAGQRAAGEGEEEAEVPVPQGRRTSRRRSRRPRRSLAGDGGTAGLAGAVPRRREGEADDARFEELKAQIAQLYEHWEEAVELNGDGK